MITVYDSTGKPITPRDAAIREGIKPSTAAFAIDLDTHALIVYGIDMWHDTYYENLAMRNYDLDDFTEQALNSIDEHYHNITGAS